VIKDNWFLVVLAASLIGTFSTLNFQVKANQKNIESVLKEFNDCKLEVRSIKKDTEFLAQIMGEIKADVKELHK